MSQSSHSTESFVPENELEQKLKNHLEGKLANHLWMKAFIDGKLFVLVDKPPNAQGTIGIESMLHCHEPDTGKTYLAAFTSPSRAPTDTQYKWGLLIDCAWLIKNIPPNTGLKCFSADGATFLISADNVRSLIDTAETRARIKERCEKNPLLKFMAKLVNLD